MRKVLVVDHHTLVCELLTRIVQRLGDDVVCHGAGAVAEAMGRLESEHYDLMLLELVMPGIADADILDTLRQRFPALPVVVVSVCDDALIMSRAMRHGAAGFVPKSASGDELLDVLRNALAGCVVLPTQLHATYSSGRTFAQRHGLSRGQMRVMALLGKGLTNREIASELAICEGTVKCHVRAIFKALKVSDRHKASLLLQREQSVRRGLPGRRKARPMHGSGDVLRSEGKLSATRP